WVPAGAGEFGAERQSSARAGLAGSARLAPDMSATSATDANALAVCPDMSPSTPSTTRKYPRKMGSQCVEMVGVQGHLPAISSQTLAIRPPTQYSLTILGLISYPDNGQSAPTFRAASVVSEEHPIRKCLDSLS